MALQRVLCSVSRRSFSTTPHPAIFSRVFKSLGHDDHLPNPFEHASGLEKKQLLAELQGNDDPFDLNITKRGAGTKDKPNVVYSAFHERLIGCICEEDSSNVVWMWIRTNEAKRCACGYWFQCKKKDPL